MKNPDYDYLNLEKESYKKCFREDCVEWFINEILEIGTYMKNCFKSDIELNPYTIPENYGKNRCWLCEKRFEKKVDCTKASNAIRDKHFAKTVVKYHCHLTGRFIGLVQIECNLITRKAHSSFIPILFLNFSGYDCHLIFEKLVNMAFEKDENQWRRFFSQLIRKLYISKNGMFKIFGFLEICGW